MSDPAERLREARRRAGYATAVEAAAAMGVREPTYVHHENGTRGLSRSAGRYAAFFRVSLEWLLEGRAARPSRAQNSVDLIGKVGAGDQVFGLEGDTAGLNVGTVDLPAPVDAHAVEVQGNSQYPRYLDGEILLVAREALPPGELIGEYAMVHCADGRRLVKIIRRTPGSKLFRLDSHNADPEEEVAIEQAYLILGTLGRRRRPGRR